MEQLSPQDLQRLHEAITKAMEEALYRVAPYPPGPQNGYPMPGQWPQPVGPSFEGLAGAARERVGEAIKERVGEAVKERVGEVVRGALMQGNLNPDWIAEAVRERVA